MSQNGILSYTAVKTSELCNYFSIWETEDSHCGAIEGLQSVGI
jgi:hypothetical protein